MNDKAARERRYVRLLLEGFSPEEARQTVKPRTRKLSARKKADSGATTDSVAPAPMPLATIPTPNRISRPTTLRPSE
jgi:hypothetical protein